jgi:hypothetical protein
MMAPILKHNFLIIIVRELLKATGEIPEVG